MFPNKFYNNQSRFLNPFSAHLLPPPLHLVIVVALLILLSILELAGLQSSYNQNRSKWNHLPKHWIIFISNVSTVAKIWNQSSYYWSQTGRSEPAHLFPIWRKMHCTYAVYVFAVFHHIKTACDFGSQCKENTKKCMLSSKATIDEEHVFLSYWWNW